MDYAIDSDDRTKPAARRGRLLAFCIAGLLALALVAVGSWLWGQRVGTERAVADAQTRSAALSARILDAGVVVGLRTEDPAVRDRLDQLLGSPAEDVLDVNLRTIDGRTVYSGAGEAGAPDDPLDGPGLQALQSRSARTELRRSADPRDTVLRVHQPVQPDDGEALLLQIDYDYTALTAQGQEAWRRFAPVTFGAMAVMALLWLCLAGLASIRTGRGAADRSAREHAWMDFIDQPQGWSEPVPARASAARPEPAPEPELSEWAQLAAQQRSARPLSQPASHDSNPPRLFEPVVEEPQGWHEQSPTRLPAPQPTPAAFGALEDASPHVAAELGPDLGSWAAPAREHITRALSSSAEPAAIPEPVSVSAQPLRELARAGHGAEVRFDGADEFGWLETVTGGTPWPAVPFSQPVPEEEVALPGAFREGGRAHAATAAYQVLGASAHSTPDGRGVGSPQPQTASLAGGRPEPAQTPQRALGSSGGARLGRPRGGGPLGDSGPLSGSGSGSGGGLRPANANGQRPAALPGADARRASRRRSLETTLTGMLVPLARHGIDARLDLPPGLKLPDDTEELLIRAAEEALHNSVSYAAAHTVKIRLDVREERVALTVDDDGRGFDPDGGHDGGRTGLETLTRLAADAGGALHVRSMPNRGTRLHLDLPAALAS